MARYSTSVMSATTYKDHVRILEFYKMRVPRSVRQAKMDAERVLSSKLCRCIRAVKGTRKGTGKGTGKGTRKGTSKGVGKGKGRNTRKYSIGASTAICRSAVLLKKGVTASRFTCKKKPRLIATVRNQQKSGQVLRRATIRDSKSIKKTAKNVGGGPIQSTPIKPIKSRDEPDIEKGEFSPSQKIFRFEMAANKTRLIPSRHEDRRDMLYQASQLKKNNLEQRKRQVRLRTTDSMDSSDSDSNSH